jgi:hypothetical protein
MARHRRRRSKQLVAAGEIGQLLSAHHQELQRLTAKVAALSLEALARGQVDDARSLLTKLYAKTAGDITPRPDEAVH